MEKTLQGENNKKKENRARIKNKRQQKQKINKGNLYRKNKIIVRE